MKNKTVKQIHIYHCGKCDNGIVKMIVTDHGETYSAEIKKCTSCKYQYGIRELERSALKPIHETTSSV